MSSFGAEVKINGYSIHFPEGRRPFAPQFAVISKVLKALSSGENGLIESPTGTGKRESSYERSAANGSVAESSKLLETKGEEFEGRLESLAAGVGTGACMQRVRSRESGCSVSVRETVSVPSARRIYFCSRTHSQLKQVVDELRNCNPIDLEGVCMSVLGGRSQGCVNKELRKLSECRGASKSLDELCREARLKTCLYSKRVGELVGFMNRRKVWDIEDMVTLGKKHKGCPFYAAREVHEKHANFIFAPYNYVIDAAVRSSTKVLLKDSIVIFDEAHNIEDVCREAGSVEVARSSLALCVCQLKSVVNVYGSLPHKGLLTFLTDILDWIDDVAVEEPPLVRSLSKANDCEIGKSGVSRVEAAFCIEWDGADVMAVFADAFGLSMDTLKVYKGYFEQIRREDEETKQLMEGEEEDLSDSFGTGHRVDLVYESVDESEKKDLGLVLSAASTAIVARLLMVFDYMLRDDLVHAPDYHVVLQKVSKEGVFESRGSKGVQRVDDVFLNFWCMSASVVFKEIDAMCHSVLLTSGTLSPFNSFASELGASFPVRLEASHVINVETQLFVGVISSIDNVSLNCQYWNQDNVKYQDAVGAAVLATVVVAPGGVLVFVSSYSLMNKLFSRWSSTGLLVRLGVRSFVEPRDSKFMGEVLDGYYAELDKPGGRAVMLAVCRGKVSEGINFSDHYARAVLIVGIPFPSLGDLKVQAKRRFQDSKNKKDASCLSGDEWYKQQAYRAVNQAVGRCVRHKNDHGAVLLLDPRFKKDSAVSNLSAWLRSRAVNFERFEDLLVPMKSFFDALLPADSVYRLGLNDFSVSAAASAGVSMSPGKSKRKQTFENETKVSGVIAAEFKKNGLSSWLL